MFTEIIEGFTANAEDYGPEVDGQLAFVRSKTEQHAKIEDLKNGDYIQIFLNNKDMATKNGALITGSYISHGSPKKAYIQDNDHNVALPYNFMYTFFSRKLPIRITRHTETAPKSPQ